MAKSVYRTIKLSMGIIGSNSAMQKSNKGSPTFPYSWTGSVPRDCEFMEASVGMRPESVVKRRGKLDLVSWAIGCWEIRGAPLLRGGETIDEIVEPGASLLGDC